MINSRITPIEITGDSFRKIGHELIDRISEFLETIDERPVTQGETPAQVQGFLGKRSLPEIATPVSSLIAEATDLLINHSLFNGHPKFLGYITSSAAPIGALADLLAASVNPNVGAEILSPMATEIERQTVQWLAELIGLSSDYGGLLVSGGNMANLTAFLAARTAKAPRQLQEDGLAGPAEKMVLYCSMTTHTWVEKAAVLFGHGSNSIRWIRTDHKNRMDNGALEQKIQEDIKEGHKPFLIVGTAGDVSTGVVDDLKGIGAVSKKYNLWFHIDGAYGIPAAVVPQLKNLFQGMEQADSIALDPHKWLYSPLEAGCTLVKDPEHLTNTFSSHPEYYNFKKDEEELALNYYEYGLQNSRGFRALKVWMTLQQVGRNGFVNMISEDIELSKYFYQLAHKENELEAVSQNLSITTLRYVPKNYTPSSDESYLNKLNESLLDELQKGGEAFLSNAIVDDKYCLRGCIVNFRTSKKDIEEIIDIIIRHGRLVHEQLK